MNTLSDWFSAGQIIAAVVGIAISLVIYLKQRQRKDLSYSVITSTPLLTVGSEIAGRIQILFDSNPVRDVKLLVLRFANTGNVPITSKDYEHPIALNFEENVRILEAEISGKEPSDLPVSIVLEEKRVIIEPTLLNNDDSITLKMLLTGYNDTLIVTGRIVGIKKIKRVTHIETGSLEDARYNITAAAIGLLIITAIYATVVLLDAGLTLPDVVKRSISFLLIIAASVTFFFFILGAIKWVASGGKPTSAFF